jgi:hypothetical protein
MDSWGRRSHCNARRALPADTYARGDRYGELAVIPQLKPSASNAHDRHFVDPCCTEANPPFQEALVPLATDSSARISASTCIWTSMWACAILLPPCPLTKLSVLSGGSAEQYLQLSTRIIKKTANRSFFQPLVTCPTFGKQKT